ncbi:protein broad-minded-like isoform X1 [Frankliniella occidentalis]|uniref:Protein broad-minded-like isoform X1 n=1 Tax=Frankliniella occidentalis TaxID=133901 RepID=A0A6J1SR83_FRAOC|nr:protein broad-minded-like isoform X1 [Frankliniella occidentalis]
MDNLDDVLVNVLEKRLGRAVWEKITSLNHLDPRMLDALCDELVQEVSLSKEMSELKNSFLHQDGEVFSLEKASNKPHDTALCEDDFKWRNNDSACSSANVSPRNERSANVYKRGRTGNHSSGQRMHALEVLLRVPVSEIVGSANWPQLQQELCESLRDDNWLVFMQVLKVLARISSSASFGPVSEGFLSLLEGLTLYYLTRHLHQELPSALHGLEFDNAVHIRIILISQCLLQILNEVPGKWIRYGEKRSQEIVDNFIDLLSMHTHHHRSLTTDQSKDVLYPFHIFSVLDPEAKWCASVMHAAFGRNILMKCILKSASLIRFILEEILIWLKSQIKLSEGVTAVYEYGKNGNMNVNMINLTVFLHCISLLELFVNSDKGYLLFPVLTSIHEEAVSVYSVLLKLLEFLNKIACEPRTRHSQKLVRMLEKICASLIVSRCSRILHGSSAELLHLLLEASNRVDNSALHIHNINILNKISECPAAVKWMLGRPIRRSREGISRLSLSSASSSSGRESILTNRTACIARRIAKATTVAVRDRNRFTSENISPVCQLLAISEKLFSSPEGYLVLESCEGQLIPLAGQLLIHIKNIMYSSDVGLLSIQRSLEAFLIGMTTTPLGFMAVSGVEGLLKCIVDSYAESPILEKRTNPQFHHLLQLSTLVPNIKINVQRKSLMKYALNQLWSSLDAKSEWMWKEEKKHFLTNVMSICSSPLVVLELLEDSTEDDDLSESSTLVEELEPLSLKELLQRGLQPSRDPSNCHVNEVALDILHPLAHSAEIAIVLEEKLKLTESIERILSEAKVKEFANDLNKEPSPRKTHYITDENARSCSHLITIVNQLRDFSSCNLLTFPQSPRSPRTHAYTSRPRVQTDLQRFLQDTRHGLHDNMWLSHARRAYRASSRSELKVPVLLDLLDQVLLTQPCSASSESQSRWPTNAAPPSLSPQMLQAIEMIIRYGCHMKVLGANMVNQHTDQLAQLLYQAKLFLGLQNSIDYFDWFVSSVFLMCSGNIDKSRSILHRVAILPTGSFVWPMVSPNATQPTAAISHHLQSLLAEYVPKAYNFLLEMGIPWWLIVRRLTHQASIPAMPLSQLPHMIALSALHSWEYYNYMHTAILAHIQPALLDSSPQSSALSLLTDIRLDTFSVGDYLPFMDKIAKLNRPQLVRDRIATATL